MKNRWAKSWGCHHGGVKPRPVSQGERAGVRPSQPGAVHHGRHPRNCQGRPPCARASSSLAAAVGDAGKCRAGLERAGASGTFERLERRRPRRSRGCYAGVLKSPHVNNAARLRRAWPRSDADNGCSQPVTAKARRESADSALSSFRLCSFSSSTTKPLVWRGRRQWQREPRFPFWFQSVLVLVPHERIRTDRVRMCRFAPLRSGGVVLRRAQLPELAPTRRLALCGVCACFC